jgi:ribosomal protein S18 acetylase RimI-like enzyme
MSPLVRAGHPGDAAAVAALHSERIGEGFLVTLGPRFLTRLYRRIARSPTAVLLVAEAGDRVVGFVAATTSTNRLYAEFLRRDAIPAAVAAAPRILRAPRRVWETLRYGTSDHDLPPAEILSIAVAADATGQGTGSALLDAALIELAQLGVEAVRVVTTVGNHSAIEMYERVGFSRRRRTEVHHGVEQEVLVWP